MASVNRFFQLTAEESHAQWPLFTYDTLCGRIVWELPLALCYKIIPLWISENSTSKANGSKYFFLSFLPCGKRDLQLSSQQDATDTLYSSLGSGETKIIRSSFENRKTWNRVPWNIIHLCETYFNSGKIWFQMLVYHLKYIRVLLNANSIKFYVWNKHCITVRMCI